ncbi:MAG: DnaD domain protein [Clostridia bacterium]|nr:DnaD domain protein [Clostridia bacterium]
MNTNNFFIMPKISYEILMRASEDALRALIALEQSPGVSFERLSKELGFDAQRLTSALGFWRAENVLSDADIPRAHSSGRSSPTAHELADSLYSAGFSFATKEAEGLWGTLSRPELDALHRAHNELGLSIESIVLLLRRLKETGATGLRQFERAALDWSKRGITDAKAAEAHISALGRADEYAEHIAKTLGLSYAALSASEKRVIASWPGLSVSDEDVLDAYRRSLPYTKGNSPIAYMNKILQKNTDTKNTAAVSDAEKEKPAPSRGEVKKRYDHEKIRQWNLEYLKRLKDEDI